MLTRTLKLIILSGAITSLAVAFSVLSLGYGGVGETAEATTAPANQTSPENDYDSYLDPCYGCTPTEDDYENLTTFELLAIYPELSGDPIGNDTADSGEDGGVTLTEPEPNEEINVNVTESAQISDNSTEPSGNATMSETFPEIEDNNCNATDC